MGGHKHVGLDKSREVHQNGDRRVWGREPTEPEAHGIRRTFVRRAKQQEGCYPDDASQCLLLNWTQTGPSGLPCVPGLPSGPGARRACTQTRCVS